MESPSARTRYPSRHRSGATPRTRRRARSRSGRHARLPASLRRSVQCAEVGLDQRAVLRWHAVGVGFQEVLAQPVVLAEQVLVERGRRGARDVLAAARLALRVEVAPVDRALGIEEPRQDLRLLLLDIVADVALADALLDLLHLLLRLVEAAEQALLRLGVAAHLVQLFADPALLVGEASHLRRVALRHRHLLRHLARDLTRLLVELRLLLADLAQPLARGLAARALSGL